LDRRSRASPPAARTVEHDGGDAAQGDRVLVVVDRIAALANPREIGESPTCCATSVKVVPLRFRQGD
jgi:hypothetical protein